MIRVHFADTRDPVDIIGAAEMASDDTGTLALFAANSETPMALFCDWLYAVKMPAAN